MSTDEQYCHIRQVSPLCGRYIPAFVIIIQCLNGCQSKLTHWLFILWPLASRSCHYVTLYFLWRSSRDSSVGRAEDCSGWCTLSSLGRRFKSVSRDSFYVTATTWPHYQRYCSRGPGRVRGWSYVGPGVVGRGHKFVSVSIKDIGPFAFFQGNSSLSTMLCHTLPLLLWRCHRTTYQQCTYDASHLFHVRSVGLLSLLRCSLVCPLVILIGFSPCRPRMPPFGS